MPYPYSPRPCRAMHGRASDYLYVASYRDGGQMLEGRDQREVIAQAVERWACATVS